MCATARHCCFDAALVAEGGAAVAASLLFALAVLGIVEHLFLVLPFRDAALWPSLSLFEVLLWTGRRVCRTEESDVVMVMAGRHWRVEWTM